VDIMSNLPKTCVVCGDLPYIYYIGEGERRYSCINKKCSLYGISFGDEWDDRPVEDELQNTIERFEAAVNENQIVIDLLCKELNGWKERCSMLEGRFTQEQREKITTDDKDRLLEAMRDLSEDAYCVGWIQGLEEACKDIVGGKLVSWGLSDENTISYYKDLLTELHDKVKGWWYLSDPLPVFILDKEHEETK
jgi:hypothetical protein